MKIYKLIVMISIITFFSLITLSSISATEITINDTDSSGIKGAIQNGHDVINLEEGIYKGLNNTNITLNNSKNITIQSMNSNKKATINGENINYFINNGGNITIKNLIIRNFIKTANSGTLNITSGGAIYNTGKLIVINCTFMNNKVVLYGGSIYNTGILNITNSIFDNCTAQSGGVIYTTKQSDITNSNFTNNKANTNNGGGIFNGQFGTLNITNSNFKNNTANQGGAIYNNNYANVFVNSSTFTNNTANQGGAVYNTNGGNFNVSYSRFIDNADSNNYTLYHSGNGGIVSDLNWWGSNDNPNLKVYGTSINNYYNMLLNSSILNNTLMVGENLAYNYYFILNGTNDNHDADKYFQYFETNIYMNNILIAVIDARNSTILNTILDYEESNFSAILNNEIQHFSYLANPKPIPPTPPEPPEPPIPPTPPEPPEPPIQNHDKNKTNKTNNNSMNEITTNASMKKTGVPAIAIILIILNSLVLVIRKK